MQLSKIISIDLRHLRYINGVENKVWQQTPAGEDETEAQVDDEKSDVDYSQMP